MGKGIVGDAPLRPHVGHDGPLDEPAPAATPAGKGDVLVAQRGAEHAIAHLIAAHPVADADHPSHRFVAQQYRVGATDKLALDDLPIGAVAYAAGLNLHQGLVGSDLWFRHLADLGPVLLDDKYAFHLLPFLQPASCVYPNT